MRVSLTSLNNRFLFRIIISPEQRSEHYIEINNEISLQINILPVTQHEKYFHPELQNTIIAQIFIKEATGYLNPEAY